MLGWKWSREAQKVHFKEQTPKRGADRACGGQACQAEGTLCRDLEGGNLPKETSRRRGLHGWALKNDLCLGRRQNRKGLLGEQ